jgi:hypothetical protein
MAWFIAKEQEAEMKRAAYFVTVLGLLAVLAGCKKQESDADAIRSGINQHLAGLKTLNLGAMDMNITSISIQGNEAQAQVEFKAKTGAPQGAGMQVAYSLEKQNGLWVVKNSQPSGGSVQHPAPGENSGTNDAGPSSGSLPNLRELVPGGGNGSPGALPPGHPRVNTQGNATPQ